LNYLRNLTALTIQTELEFTLNLLVFLAIRAISDSIIWKVFELRQKQAMPALQLLAKERSSLYFQGHSTY
jgi:hypothetical protein